MNVIGLLVRGTQGEEYPIMAGPEGSAGAVAFRVFQRQPQGWRPATLSPADDARLRGEVLSAIHKPAQQCGVIVPGPVLWGHPDASTRICDR